MILPAEYQELAARTECDQRAARARYANPDALSPVRLNHAVIGMMGEVGELAAAVERWLHYGQALDLGNIREEVGDVLWYVALACNTLDLDMGSIMEANIRKLRTRYPEKYRDELAREENRNRAAELKSMTEESNAAS